MADLVNLLEIIKGSPVFWPIVGATIFLKLWSLFEKTNLSSWLYRHIPTLAARLYLYAKHSYNDCNSYRSPNKIVVVKGKSRKLDAWCEMLFFSTMATICTLYGLIVLVKLTGDFFTAFAITWKYPAGGIFFLACAFVAGWYIGAAYKVAKLNKINLQPWKLFIKR